MPFVEVNDVKDLKIGELVKLEGSWFSHPFPTNTFTIKSKEDLVTIQGLTNVTVLYDPDRTESAGLDLPTAHEPLAEDLDDLESARGVISLSVENDNSGKEREPLIPETDLSNLLDRREDYREYFDHLRKVEGVYQKTLMRGHDLFRQLTGRRPIGLKTGDAMITNILETVNNSQTIMSLIDQVGNNGVAWGLSEHAVNVCTLSLLIGRQFALDEEMLIELGRGALFHDIGYRALPMNVKFHKGGMKVEADPELRFLHPELGNQLIASFLDAGPLLQGIIAQHHERLDGSGFPQGLRQDDLSLLTRIVMVADHYDELCNAPDPETSLNPHAALSRLYRHVVVKGEASKFCEKVVQALVQAIGVYPPGSLVELTDGFRGVVSAINVHQPTKPIVLLYAPWLCRTDGLLVNLARDSRIEIVRAIHPKDMPQAELAYLSPRRMAMFVHTPEPMPTGDNKHSHRPLKPALNH